MAQQPVYEVSNECKIACPSLPNISFFFHGIYFFMYTGSLQKFDGVECFTVLNISGGLFRGGVRVGSRGSIEPTDFETLY